jgi:hypothetical protein
MNLFFFKKKKLDIWWGRHVAVGASLEQLSIKELSVKIDGKFGIIENIRIIVTGVTNYRSRMKCI